MIWRLVRMVRVFGGKWATETNDAHDARHSEFLRPRSPRAISRPPRGRPKPDPSRARERRREGSRARERSAPRNVGATKALQCQLQQLQLPHTDLPPPDLSLVESRKTPPPPVQREGPSWRRQSVSARREQCSKRHLEKRRVHVSKAVLYTVAYVQVVCGRALTRPCAS